MKTVYKYILKDTLAVQTVTIPLYSKILTVDVIDFQIILYVLCDPNQIKFKQNIIMYETGVHFDSEAVYINTIKLIKFKDETITSSGTYDYVLHVFALN